MKSLERISKEYSEMNSRLLGNKARARATRGVKMARATKAVEKLFKSERHTDMSKRNKDGSFKGEAYAK